MCGIVGWVSATEGIGRDAFERMTDRLAHRGPDGRGTWYDLGDRVALGHRRLAIVDLSPAGAQPMRLPGRELHLTYNGEIYNHPELRRELEAKGAVYRSESDSESILHAYAAWGPDCVDRLIGIFAFAIWDGRERTLFAARDHLGVKPFYFAPSPRGLAFASQPGAFLDLPGFAPEIDVAAFADALAYGVVPGSRAAYRGVAKLEPGHALTWRDGDLSFRRYWRPPEEPDLTDPDRAAAEIESVVEAAVGDQLMSDVPVACYLSGGIDSSLVAAVAGERAGAPATAFTLGFDHADYDERPYAELAAASCGARLVSRELARADLDDAIDAAVEAYDEPFGIDAALPMVAIARLTAEHGAKVVLSGDGADELFAGYRHYDELAKHYARYGRVTAAKGRFGLGAALATLRSGPFDPFAVYGAHNGRINGPLAAAVAGPRLDGTRSGRWREAATFRFDLPPAAAAQRADLATYLPDEILVKVDRATMAFGIEARVPLLDKRLVELAFRIEPSLHRRGGERKTLLKAAARRWLPPSILTPRKRGFSPPLNEWLEDPPLRRRMVETVRDGRLAGEGFIDASGLDRKIDGLRRPQGGLLLLYLLERWAQRWVYAPAAVEPRMAAQ